jgi:hypothetical protein
MLNNSLLYYQTIIMSYLQTETKHKKANSQILPDLKIMPIQNDINNWFETHIYFHPIMQKCVFNKYGQCIKGYRYFCPYCDYGIGGMFSLCLNKDCSNSYKFIEILEEDNKTPSNPP